MINFSIKKISKVEPTFFYYINTKSWIKKQHAMLLYKKKMTISTSIRKRKSLYTKWKELYLSNRSLFKTHTILE